ncbi:MAG: hypothetical protein J6W60_07935 [Treponema sp.]|nr:hypothetical protein [Treponema sp.]
MTQTQLTLYIIRLVLGGLATFFAILVWGKTRDSAWMCLIAGIVLEYCGTVYNMFLDFGVVFSSDLSVAGIPLTTILFTVVPPLFFILAFIMILIRKR